MKCLFLRKCCLSLMFLLHLSTTVQTRPRVAKEFSFGPNVFISEDKQGISVWLSYGCSLLFRFSITSFHRKSLQPISSADPHGVRWSQLSSLFISIHSQDKTQGLLWLGHHDSILLLPLCSTGNCMYLGSNLTFYKNCTTERVQKQG